MSIKIYYGPTSRSRQMYTGCMRHKRKSFYIMNTIQKYISALFFLLLPFIVNAQTVSGFIHDNEGKAIPYATVSLLEESDSSFVAGTVTGDDGRFTMPATPQDRMVKVSSIGYATAFATARDSMDIRLETVSQNLGEVTVTGHRPVFRIEKNLFVTTIQGTVYSKLGMAADVLKQLPLMGSDGSTVIGRGKPLFFINNRRMTDPGQLGRLTADMIKDIKIDMAPGAKYGSDVRAVVYITTVKPVGEGLGGYVLAYLGGQPYLSGNGSYSFNYRKKNLDVFTSGNLNGLTHSIYRRNDSYRFNYGGDVVSASYDGKGNVNSESGSVSAGFNWTPTQRQSVGGNYYFGRTFAQNTKQNYTNLLQIGEQTDTTFTEQNDHKRSDWHQVVVYYENRFSDKTQLNMDGSFVFGDSYGHQRFEGDGTSGESDIEPISTSRYNMWALRGTMTNRVLGGTLQYGFEASTTHYHSQYWMEQYVYGGNNLTGNYDRSDNESKQKAARLFASYSRTWGKLFTELGLKYEYADYTYYSGKVRQDASSRSYNYVLPSLSMSYTLGKAVLMMSYNVYTQKPGYGNLNGTPVYMNSIRYDKGNPQLKTAYSHETALSLSWGDLQASCAFGYNKDAAITWMDVLQDRPVVMSTYYMHSFSNMNASVTYSPTWFKIWYPSFNAWMYKQWLDYGGVSFNRPCLGISWKNMVRLPREWMVTINADGHLRGCNDTYMNHTAVSLGASVRKRIGGLYITMGASDIFNTKERGSSSYSNVWTGHYVNNHGPSFYLQVTYQFNFARSKYKGRTAGSDEINRL